METKPISKNYLRLLFIGIMLFVSGLITSQKFAVVPESSSIIIYGTSNLHDWETRATQLDGTMEIARSEKINLLIIKIPVISLKSGKRAMDNKTYDLIDERKNPKIIFQLTSCVPLKITQKDNEYTLTGNLTLAGETKKISFKVKQEITESGNYRMKGEVPLKMTDFKMDPPKALLGVLKTGDEVIIKFDTIWKESF